MWRFGLIFGASRRQHHADRCVAVSSGTARTTPTMARTRKYSSLNCRSRSREISFEDSPAFPCSVDVSCRKGDASRCRNCAVKPRRSHFPAGLAGTIKAGFDAAGMMPSRMMRARERRARRKREQSKPAGKAHAGNIAQERSVQKVDRQNPRPDVGPPGTIISLSVALAADIHAIWLWPRLRFRRVLLRRDSSSSNPVRRWVG